MLVLVWFSIQRDLSPFLESMLHVGIPVHRYIIPIDASCRLARPPLTNDTVLVTLVQHGVTVGSGVWKAWEARNIWFCVRWVTSSLVVSFVSFLWFSGSPGIKQKNWRVRHVFPSLQKLAKALGYQEIEWEPWSCCVRGGWHFWFFE